MKIKVVGPYSGQIGGVASFMKRLTTVNNIDEVYDPYTGYRYVKSDKSFKLINRVPSFLRFIYLIYFCSYAKEELVFLNFSTVNSIFLEFLLGKASNRRYVFHNGDPIRVRPFGLDKLPFKLKRIKVISLTNKQMNDFYERYSCISCKDVVYIPPQINFSLPEKDKDILIAGYAKSLYNIDNFLECFSASDQKISRYNVSVVLYGEPEPQVYNKITRLIRDIDGVDMYENMSENNFLKLLARHKLYFRPTSVDSYGFTVQDASILNCEVLCSSVILRPEGVHLFTLPVNDKVIIKLISILENFKVSSLPLSDVKSKTVSSFNSDAYS